MIRLRWSKLVFLAVVLAATPSLRAALAGVDAGLSASELIRGTEPAVLREWGEQGAWLRIRGLPNPEDPTKADQVATERAALARLKELGFRSVPFLRWTSWPSGVRLGGGHRFPLDLREAHARARRYAVTYGELVAGFEFDNEPDISFAEDNAETYAAFLKACYWGVRSADRGPSVVWWPTLWGGVPWPRLVMDPGSRPLVIMAPLALPPGPYFEQLGANEFLGYTDAFNYHYYGHAEDFSRVYRQFEDALGARGTRGFRVQSSGFRVGEPSTGHRSSPSDHRPPVTVHRKLPVMLTEYGFSGLSGPDRQRAERRVAQWRWFREVGEQIRDLRIAAPMAFYLPPYYERDMMEFGLTVAPVADGERSTVDGGRLAEHRTQTTVGSRLSTGFRSGSLEFRPEDFGATAEEPWMRRIGKKVGGNEAAPALAWLMEAGGKERYRPRDWEVEVESPSPVVIDFVAGKGLSQMKRYNGYLISEATGEGAGELVLYNFSARAIEGRLRWSGTPEAVAVTTLSDPIAVPAQSRVVVPVKLRCTLSQFEPAPVSVVFEPTVPEVPRAVLATTVYPSTDGMTASVIDRFDHSAEASADNRALLLRRPLAAEERKLEPVGRWLVSAGARVEETAAGRWRFTAEAFRGDPRQGRATFELPLRDDFVFPDGAALRLGYRLAEPKGVPLGKGLYFEIYVRTANGNLYVVWPWAHAHGEWRTYLELKENYTMMFHNRANLPWRFSENRPVSLVFSFYSPSMPSAVVEIDSPQLVRIGKQQ